MGKTMREETLETIKQKLKELDFVATSVNFDAAVIALEVIWSYEGLDTPESSAIPTFRIYRRVADDLNISVKCAESRIRRFRKMFLNSASDLTIVKVFNTPTPVRTEIEKLSVNDFLYGLYHYCTKCNSSDVENELSESEKQAQRESLKRIKKMETIRKLISHCFHVDNEHIFSTEILMASAGFMYMMNDSLNQVINSLDIYKVHEYCDNATVTEIAKNMRAFQEIVFNHLSRKEMKTIFNKKTKMPITTSKFMFKAATYMSKHVVTNKRRTSSK